MKYFVNINSAEELRKIYRELVITMHPDKGGNAEEFKAMQAEFETLKKQYQNGTTYTHENRHTETAEQRARREAEEQREREEWARWEAEKKAEREQEEREKAERIRKAQEISRAAVRAWSKILERVNVDKTGEKARFYRFDDKKQAAAFVATTKRNIKAVINHYFPGLKVAVKISGEIWKEKFIITWEDGPSEKQLRETCKELYFFIPAYYTSDPYADYGEYKCREDSEPWREAYGQALGDVTDFETERTLSEEGLQQAEEIAARYFSNFDPKSQQEEFETDLAEFANLCKVVGLEKCCNEFRALTGKYYDDMYGEFSTIKGTAKRRQLKKFLAEYLCVNVAPKEKKPEFIPTYGPVYKAIKKALGANVFFTDVKDSRKNAEKELTIFEAAEMLAQGEEVTLGHKSTWDGETVIYGTDRGGLKTQQKRAAKFEAVGIILEELHLSIYGSIRAKGIKAETLEALRKEAQDIERQRKEWESGKRNKSTKRTSATTDEHTTNAPELDDPRAEGLELVEIENGVAVTGERWATFRNRKALRAKGLKWNKEAQRWETTDPTTVEAVRAWFGAESVTTSEPTTDEPQAETTADEPQAEATANEPQAETTANEPQAEPTTDEPQAEPTANEPQAEAANLAPVMAAFADLLQTFGEIINEAAQWEGVTIPADTLQRWRNEATEGSRATAERLCDVCGQLADMTPDSRREFGALGQIFWIIAEQMRNGYTAETLQAAIDYSRRQLLELIDRTQNSNQARAIREAIEPHEGEKAAA